MKRIYENPAMQVVDIQEMDFVCASNEVFNTDGNADLEYGGGGSGPARIPTYSVWDEDVSE